MTELETIKRAKMYIDDMANGIDPISGQPAVETDMVNNVRVSRCLFYVSDILRQVIENGGAVGEKKKTKKQPFSLSAEQLSHFRYSVYPITVSEIARRLNELTASDGMAPIKYSAITGWLLQIGMLQTRTSADGKSLKRPTAQGQEIGIVTDKRVGQNGEYTAVVYQKEAQQFVIDHLEAILDWEESAKEEKKREPKAAPAEQGQPWTIDQEDRLIELFAKHVPLSEIAAELCRSEGSIRSRLDKLGLADY